VPDRPRARGAGAKVEALVKEVITNGAAFERALGDSAAELTAGGAPSPALGKADPTAWSASAAGAGKAGGAPRAASHRLAVHPRHDADAAGSHGCPLCPANLCKVRAPKPPSWHTLDAGRNVGLLGCTCRSSNCAPSLLARVATCSGSALSYTPGRCEL
jgi:hypothetical protein